jgi:hypothetical protein
MNWYLNLLKTRPIVAKTISTTGLIGLGDLLAQTIFEKVDISLTIMSRIPKWTLFELLDFLQLVFVLDRQCTFGMAPSTVSFQTITCNQ